MPALCVPSSSFSPPSNSPSGLLCALPAVRKCRRITDTHARKHAHTHTRARACRSAEQLISTSYFCSSRVPQIDSNVHTSAGSLRSTNRRTCACTFHAQKRNKDKQRKMSAPSFTNSPRGGRSVGFFFGTLFTS